MSFERHEMNKSITASVFAPMKRFRHPLEKLKLAVCLTIAITHTALATTEDLGADHSLRTAEKQIEQLTGFSKVEVTTIAPHKIHIRHSEGGSTITYDRLSQALRDRFGMTKETALTAAAKEQRLQSDAREAQQKQQYLSENHAVLSGVVSQVFPNGILIRDAALDTGREFPLTVERWICVDGPSALNPGRAERYRRIISETTERQIIPLPDLVFVHLDPRGIFDGATIDAVVWRHSTTSIFAEDRELTLPSWTTDPGAAWENINAPSARRKNLFPRTTKTDQGERSAETVLHQPGD